MLQLGFFFFCKQKTAYEMRISDWSVDVCSSDLAEFPGNNPSDRVRLEERWGRSSERWRHVRDGSLEFKPAMTVNNRVGYVSPECVRTSAKYCAPSFIPLTVSAYYSRSEARRVGKE